MSPVRPLFDRTLRDVPLLLDDDELLIVDAATRAEVDGLHDLDGCRFGPKARDAAVEHFFGARRMAIRRARLTNAAPIPLISIDDPSLEAAVAGSRRVIVATHGAELRTAAELISGVGTPVHSMKNHIHPLVAGPGDLDERLERLETGVASERCLLILAVMRTGSYLLSELVSEAGLGSPEEHLGDEIINALRGADRTDLSFVEWFGTLRAYVGADDWFSTKIISHYLQRLSGVLTAEERKFLDDAIRAADVVVMTREDEVRQAVSAYVASVTKVYRARTDHLVERAQTADVPYDRERIAERLQFVSSQNGYVRGIAVEHSANSPRQTFSVTYEQLAADHVSVMSDIVERLGVPEAPISPAPANRKLAGAVSERLARQFIDEVGESGQSAVSADS